MDEFENDGPYAPLASPDFTGVPTAPTAVTGTSTNQLATTLYVKNEIDLISYLNVACVVRINATTGIWEIINDGTHKSINVTSIENLEIPGFSTFNFRLNYPESGGIGSLLGVEDETYGSQGLGVGASVGTNKANFRINKSGMSLQFNCTSSIWTMVTDTQAIAMPTNFSSSFNTTNGNLTISHPTLIFGFSDGIFLESRNNIYKPEYVSKTTTSFVIRFRDAAGNIPLTANDDMDFNVFRSGMWRVPNANLVSISTAANFWIQGIFHKNDI